ncbi:MAG TPA: phosphoglucosamine mutase, partial [bacterium]|nr:phosphoglucosamine mutase [bacterium]
SGLCAAVQEHQADLGIAVDPDADRCGLVDANGEYLVEEYTLVIAVDAVLTHFRKVGSSMLDKPVVTNLSTTLAVDKVAAKYGVEVVRTPVGEINVTERMAQLDAAIGGEGNGGVILAESHLGRDSLVAATLVLQQLTEKGTTLRDYYESLPQYVMSKQKVTIGDVDPDELLQQVLEDASDAETDTQDGVKFTWSDHWVHLRKSNTEPILRVYAEAGSQQEADEIASRYLAKLNQYASQLS